MAKNKWENDNVLKGDKYMEIPEELKQAIENQLEGIKSNEVIENAQKISERYRNNDGTGKKMLTKQQEALSYSISRMPSTYCAVYSALSNVLKNYNGEINSLLDVGAGTGAATWAVNQLIDLKQCTCIERETAMINIGKSLMKNSVLEGTRWKSIDLINESIDETADIVVTSYMINELPKQEKENVIKKLWNMAKKILLIVEPGTPAGFANIIRARTVLLNEGASIIAPCSHQNKCPIPKDDWCSFYVRVNRSGMQRKVKQGELSYEDEKFSYIAFAKTDIQKGANEIKEAAERILRHPQINQGFVKVKLCTSNGIQEKIFSKKDGEIYKKVKKLDAGDILPLGRS